MDYIPFSTDSAPVSQFHQWTNQVLFWRKLGRDRVPWYVPLTWLSLHYWWPNSLTLCCVCEWRLIGRHHQVVCSHCLKEE